MEVALLTIISTTLSLWLSEKKTKYVDEHMSLEEKINEELKKPIPQTPDEYCADPNAYRNNAALDNYNFQLCNLSLAISAAVKAENVGSQS